MQNTSSKNSQILEHPALAIFFVLFFPLLLEYVFSDFVRGSELNSRIGWFVLILAAVWAFRNKLFPFLLLGVFLISGCMDNLYAVTFGGVLTTASFEAIALTDSHEAIGFLQTYTSLTNMSLLGIYAFGSLYLINKTKIPASRSRHDKVIIILGLLMAIVAIYRIGYLNKYYDTIPGFAGTLPSYFSGHVNVEKEIETRKKLVANSPVIATLDQADKKQTYLIIIGESLSRNHMGIYGYHRNTTPELGRLRKESPNELIVHTNTISSHVQTQPSLQRALTQIDEKNRLPVNEALSIVDLANKAGFKTWWISNQQPLRSTISAIANMADETHYISNDHHGVQVRRFDGLMQPHIEKALKDDATHKVIFVHLMGSHLQYKNRYPDEFSVFTDGHVKGYESILSDKQIDYINSYDNSVLYTDAVVAKMMKALKTTSEDNDSISAALMFSDHGEEIFDTKNFVGHGPDSVTATMVEIPYVIWTSAQYRQDRPAIIDNLAKNSDKAYSLDSNFHFVSGLMGIQSSTVYSNNSLTSDQYAPGKRLVYNVNYDSRIKDNLSGKTNQ